MSKKLQAYFETEDIALRVKAELIKLNVRNLEIGKLEDGNEENSIPLAVPIITGGVTQVNSGIIAGAPVIAATGNRAFHDDQYTLYHAVLSGEVDENGYQQAVEIVQSNNGHIE